MFLPERAVVFFFVLAFAAVVFFERTALVFFEFFDCLLFAVAVFAVFFLPLLLLPVKIASQPSAYFKVLPVRVIVTSCFSRRQYDTIQPCKKFVSERFEVERHAADCADVDSIALLRATARPVARQCVMRIAISHEATLPQVAVVRPLARFFQSACQFAIRWAPSWLGRRFGRAMCYRQKHTRTAADQKHRPRIISPIFSHR